MRPRQVVSNGARHTGSAEPGGEVMGARFGRALELAQDNLPVADVPDDARRHAVQTDEAESAHDLLDPEQARKVFLVA
jgi:hypothetical protein